MQMAYPSSQLAKCSDTRSSPRRRSMPASSTKPSAARWTNSPKPSAAQVLVLVEGKVRREKLMPQRKLQPQPTLLYQHPQPQTYKHNKGARPRRAPCVFVVCYYTTLIFLLFLKCELGSCRRLLST